MIPDGSENETVENDEDENGDEDKSDGVGDENVVAGVGRVFPYAGRCQCRHHTLFRGVVVEGLVEVGEVGHLHVRPELEEPWDVEDERAGHDGKGVRQVVVVVTVGLKMERERRSQISVIVVSKQTNFDDNYSFITILYFDFYTFSFSFSPNIKHLSFIFLS